MNTLAIRGGHVLSPGGSVTRRDVLVDAAAGTITDVVAPEDDLEGDRTLDATGGVVMPSLVNAHTHVAMALLRGVADDKPLHDWLEENVFPLEAAMTAADVRAGAALGALEMIKGGTTTFCDMYFHEESIADVVEDSGLKALLGHGVITLGKDDVGITDELETATSFAREYDGAADGRITTAVMPHAVRTVDGENLATLAEWAGDLDVALHLHCSETAEDVRAVRDREGASPVAAADDAGALSARSFIAHGVHLDDADVDRLADAGAGVAHCPTANMKLASGMAPVADLLEADVTVGIGTDGPASNNDLDMFEELRQAALVAKARTGRATAVPATTALHLGTAGGARLLGRPTGRLEIDAPADLAVVDVDQPQFTPAHDLRSHLVYVASAGDVRHTVCDGRVLMRDREVLTMDEPTVRERATAAADDLLERAEAGR